MLHILDLTFCPKLILQVRGLVFRCVHHISCQVTALAYHNRYCCVQGNKVAFAELVNELFFAILATKERNVT